MLLAHKSCFRLQTRHLAHVAQKRCRRHRTEVTTDRRFRLCRRRAHHFAFADFLVELGVCRGKRVRPAWETFFSLPATAGPIGQPAGASGIRHRPRSYVLTQIDDACPRTSLGYASSPCGISCAMDSRHLLKKAGIVRNRACTLSPHEYAAAGALPLLTICNSNKKSAPRGGIGPPTRGFSIRSSPPWKKPKINLSVADLLKVTKTCMGETRLERLDVRRTSARLHNIALDRWKGALSVAG